MRQDSVNGRLAYLPWIEESHKEIFFIGWEIRPKHVEVTMFNVKDISNNLIETINDNLFKENLISNCHEGALTYIKLLTKT